MNPTNLIVPTPPLPVEGTVELGCSAEAFWQRFEAVRRWHEWNPSIWRSWVAEDRLAVGARLWLVFNPIEPRFLYKLPAPARIVELEPAGHVTWEVELPGFHALHRYHVEAIGDDRCRFGSWEVAEGALYFAVRRFWLAHFRFVRDRSLAGAPALSSGRPRR